MKSKYNFDFQIETRSSILGDGTPRYIVKGFATVPNHPYAYKYFKNGVSFKEMFTDKGVKNLIKKLKSKNIFVDALHELGTLHNTKVLLEKIQSKTGVNIKEEANSILSQIKHSDIPLAKFNSISLEGNKPFIETELNPLYREVDEAHKKYFDAIWHSLQNGFLNKFSINFKPISTETEVINGEIIPKIDDVDVFGISYTQGAANEMADITEVAMRSAMESDEVKRMEEEKKENTELKKELSELKKKEVDRLEEEKKKAEEVKKAEEKQKEEETKKSSEDKTKEIEKQKVEIQKLKEETEKRLQGKGQETSITSPEDKFRTSSESTGNEVIKNILSILPEIKTPAGGTRIAKYAFYKNPHTRPNMEGKAGFGELIKAQGVIDGVLSYPEDTQRALKAKDDLIIKKEL